MTEIPEHLLKRAQAKRQQQKQVLQLKEKHRETHVSPLTSLSAARQQKLEAQLPLQKNQVVQ